MRALLACGLLAAAACRSTPPGSDGAFVPESVPAADPSLPGALALHERHLAATGLRPILERTSSVYVIGGVEREGAQPVGEFEVWRARPARSAMRVWLPTVGEMLYGCDGTHAWAHDPVNGTQVLAGSDLAKACAGAVYDHLLRRPESLETFVTVGRRRFEAKDCYEVYGLLAEPAGSEPYQRSFREYYDVDSGLLRGIVERSGSSRGFVEVTRVFSEYAPLAGSLIAHRTVQRSPGLTLVFTVEEVRYDGVSDEAFEPPLSVAASFDP